MKIPTDSTLLLLALLIGIGTLLSCKEDSVATDTTKPTVMIDEPTSNDTISVTGNEVHVEFVASDNDKLQSVDVRVVNSADSLYFSDSPNVSGLKTFSYHEHFTPSAMSLVQLRLTVTASDAANNTTTATVTFYIRP
jgi:hypothetical protein